MSDFLFALDYGTLEDASVLQKRITNPAELIRGKELYRMLRMCAIEERVRFEECSDWELFSAFLRALPLLRGFPTAYGMQRLLCDAAGVEPPLCEKDALLLWETCVKRFEADGMTFSDLLSVRFPCLYGADAPPNSGALSVMDALSLLPKTCTSFFEWRSVIERAVLRFFECECREILFEVPEGFSFVEPNPYLVGEALGKARKNREESAALVSQLFREICVHAKKRRMTVLIKVRRNADCVLLLRYAEKCVGLPKLCLCTEDPMLCDEVTALAVRLCADFSVALSLSAFPTEHELEAAVRSVAARYSVARLGLITGGDLRLCTYTQATARIQMERIMKKL